MVGTPRVEVARKRARLIELAAAGMSTAEISRQLNMDTRDVRRHRNAAGHPAPKPVRQPLTLEERWRSLTRPVDGGHLEWLGERQRTSGTPILRYKGTTYTAAALGFQFRTGRKASGYAFAECGFTHCVAPEHIDDTATRTRDRDALRLILGMAPAPDRCGRGHDQTLHGRRETGGGAYCAACRREQRAAKNEEADHA